MATTRYLWNDVTDTVMMEKDGEGNTTAVYNTGPSGRLQSMRRGGKTYNYHFDGRGNTTCLTDQTGKKTDTYSYDAFGNQRSQTGTTKNPYRFGGQFGYQYNEATDDYYVRARPYEPKQGRWPSKDPLRFADGLNPYVYAGNGPTNQIDPTGLIGIFFTGAGQKVGSRTVINRLFTQYIGDKKILPINIVPANDLSAAGLNKQYACRLFCLKYVHLDDHCRMTFDPAKVKGIDIFGWSRGGIAAYVAAHWICKNGCLCKKQCYEGCKKQTVKQRIKNVPVRFLSVIDPVQFSASSPEMLYKTVGCCVKRYQVIWAGKKTKGLKAKAFNDRPNPTIKCPADPTTLDTTTFLTRDHIDVGWDDPIFKYIKKAFKAVAPDSI